MSTDKRLTKEVAKLTIPHTDRLVIPVTTATRLEIPKAAHASLDALSAPDLPAAESRAEEERGLLSRLQDAFYTLKDSLFGASSKDANEAALERAIAYLDEDRENQSRSLRNTSHLGVEDEGESITANSLLSGSTSTHSSLEIFKLINWAKSKFAVGRDELVREVAAESGAATAAYVQGEISDDSVKSPKNLS